MRLNQQTHEALALQILRSLQDIKPIGESAFAEPLEGLLITEKNLAKWRIAVVRM